MVPLLIVAGATAIAYFKGKTDSLEKILKPVPLGDVNRLTVGHVALLSVYGVGLFWIVKKGARWIKKVF